MKKHLIIILLITSQFTYPQPGESDFLKSRIAEISSITDSLTKDPKNYPLIWARTELIFRPFFSMYTRPDFESAEDTANTMSAFSLNSAFKYKEIDILNELNKLIDHADVLAVPGFGTGIIYAPKTVNKANFYFRRGQYFYLKNNRTKAIADYLKAMDSNPDAETEKSLCVAIAAYYFNLDVEPGKAVTFNQINLEKALDYIDRIAPQFDKGIVDLPLKTHLDFESPYEQEKLQLLELTEERKRLAEFYINKTYSFFNLYNKLVEQSKIDKTANSDIKRILAFAVESLSQSEKYLPARKIDFRIEPE